MAATGTDGGRINKRFAPLLPHSGDGSGRFLSVPGDPDPGQGSDRNPLPCRVLSLSDGGSRGEAPGGFEPPVEVLQTSALPLGYGAGVSPSSYRYGYGPASRFHAHTALLAACRWIIQFG